MALAHTQVHTHGHSDEAGTSSATPSPSSHHTVSQQTTGNDADNGVSRNNNQIGAADEASPAKDLVLEPPQSWQFGGKSWRQMQSDAQSLRWHGLRLLKRVGSGLVSTVYQAEDLEQKDENGKPVTVGVRVMDWSCVLGDYQRSIYPRLVRLYENMPPHPNVVKVLQRLVDGQTTFLVQEWCSMGSLRAALEPPGCMARGVAEATARNFLLQICHGLQFLQEQGVAHGRLTCENILLDKGFKVKLTDYGYPPSSCTNCTDDDIHLRYRAPELLRGKPFTTFAADVWSLGVVLYMMLHASLPYSARDVASADRCINMPPLQLRTSLSYPCVLLLKRLLTYSARFRPNLQSVMTDPWVIQRAAMPNTLHPQCFRDHAPSELQNQERPGRVEEGEGKSPPTGTPTNGSFPPPPSPRPLPSSVTPPDSSEHLLPHPEEGSNQPTTSEREGAEQVRWGTGTGVSLDERRPGPTTTTTTDTTTTASAMDMTTALNLSLLESSLADNLRKCSPLTLQWHRSFLGQLCKDCLVKELNKPAGENRLSKYIDNQGRRMTQRVAAMFARYTPSPVCSISIVAEKKAAEDKAEKAVAASGQQEMKDQLYLFLRHSQRMRAKFFHYYAGVIPPTCREFPLPPVLVRKADVERTFKK